MTLFGSFFFSGCRTKMGQFTLIIIYIYIYIFFCAKKTNISPYLFAHFLENILPPSAHLISSWLMSTNNRRKQRKSCFHHCLLKNTICKFVNNSKQQRTFQREQQPRNRRQRRRMESFSFSILQIIHIYIFLLLNFPLCVFGVYFLAEKV
jgi:hypothetical protein